MNELRATVGVDPWTPSNQAEAFDRLQKERAVALWLEARRRSDLYRWGGDPVDDPMLRGMHENAPEVSLEGRDLPSVQPDDAGDEPEPLSCRQPS